MRTREGWLGLLLLCASLGCGQGGATWVGGGMHGSVSGQALVVQDAVVVSQTLGSAQEVAVYLTDQGNVCPMLAKNTVGADQTTLTILLTNLDSQGQPAMDVQAGIYQVANPDGTAIGNVAQVTFQKLSACTNVIPSGLGIGVSGTVSITHLSTTTGTTSGTFDVTFASGDHVTGSFNADVCSAADFLGGGSTPTCG